MSKKQFGYIGAAPTQSFNNLSAKYNPINATSNIEYLVIAGGGAGGYNNAGGGGAGGYRTSFGTGNISGRLSAVESDLSIQSGKSFTVTVGAGGTASTSGGSDGSDSVFSSITSTGGGKGGSNNNGVGSDGGSGG